MKLLATFKSYFLLSLFSAYHLKLLFLCTQFHETTFNNLDVTKGHNSVKNVIQVMVLNL